MGQIYIVDIFLRTIDDLRRTHEIHSTCRFDKLGDVVTFTLSFEYGGKRYSCSEQVVKRGTESMFSDAANTIRRKVLNKAFELTGRRMKKT